RITFGVILTSGSGFTGGGKPGRGANRRFIRSAGTLARNGMKSVPPVLAGGADSQRPMQTGVINTSAHADATALMTPGANQSAAAITDGSSASVDRAYSFADLSVY